MFTMSRMKEIKVGDMISWCKSTYIVIKIVNEEALLKQNFSIGTVLMGTVPLSDLSLIN